MDVTVEMVSDAHLVLVDQIVSLIEIVSKEPNTALVKRSPELIREKISKGDAVVATSAGEVVGFGYLSPWEDKKFVSHSGVVVRQDQRGDGLGKLIKRELVSLTRKKFPEAIIFGLTLNPSVMKLNSELGYIPVSYDQISTDDAFWKGCETCPYHEILLKMERVACLCTAMRLDPKTGQR
jgi:N-acetylglutamate synthase-like GNAT family acetyltransferase